MSGIVTGLFFEETKVLFDFLEINLDAPTQGLDFQDFSGG